MEQKECKECEEMKPFEAFYLVNGKPNGNRCKVCERRHRAAIRRSTKGKANKQAQDRRYYERNRDRILTKRADRYAENKEKELQANAVYRKKNKDKISKQKQVYYQNNKKRIQAQIAKRLKERPDLRLRKVVSNAAQRAIKSQGKTKGGRTFEALPYSPRDLVEHIESQFDDKMTWDNYGTYWNIDHIYPQSLLPYDSLEHPNFQRCWALDNLQPLEAIENIKKGNKVLA